MFKVKTRKKSKNLIIKKAPLIIMALLLSGCGQENYVSQSQLLLGTTVTISMVTADAVKANEAIKEAFAEVRRIENEMSYFKKDSQLSKLNEQASLKPFKTSDELFFIIKTCQEFSRITQGAFDVTATSLDKDKGYEDIILDEKNKTIIFRDKKTKIDLGGAAKGYAVDRAVYVLRQKGFNDILVDAGGDIFASGKYKNKKWAIGIRNPINKRGISEKIKIEDMAVATSGNYLRNHIVTTAKEHSKVEVLSATVIAPSCLEADILATAAFVEPNRALEAAEELEAIEILLITSKGKMTEAIQSSNFASYKY
jgi:thiamine biosynthesis lipoprotein